MGMCGSTATAASEASDNANRNINKNLDQDRRKMENEVKLLLLGAGESGKSTIAKQMKIIHLKGFTDVEKRAFKSVIYNNIINSMKSLVLAAKSMEIKISPDNEKAAEELSKDSEYFSGQLSPELVKQIKSLWVDEGIKEAFSRSAEFQLNDCAGYYFDNIDRIVNADYVPTEQDILRSRAKTTGIVEIEFDIKKYHFRLLDVGGQRSERKKWMHCFQDVTAILFCVAMSEYDLKLYEDDTTNRMQESLKLFRDICTNRWFTDTAVVLFLNKKDIFAEKINKVDLTVCFPKYTGGRDYDKVTQTFAHGLEVSQPRFVSFRFFVLYSSGLGVHQRTVRITEREPSKEHLHAHDLRHRHQEHRSCLCCRPGRPSPEGYHVFWTLTLSPFKNVFIVPFFFFFYPPA